MTRIYLAPQQGINKSLVIGDVFRKGSRLHPPQPGYRSVPRIAIPCKILHPPDYRHPRFEIFGVISKILVLEGTCCKGATRQQPHLQRSRQMPTGAFA